MSSGSQDTRVEVLRDLTRELRQFKGLGASFFRVAAAQVGMTVTDMQIIDLLESVGEASAGQLAELTGLTTGAIAGILKRLEEAGLVRRERDKNDGRRVLVQLVEDKDEMHEVRSVVASFGKTEEELVMDYDDEHLAFLLEFLKRSNALSRRELLRLQEGSRGKEESFSLPLGNLTNARLVISSGISNLTLRAEEGMTDLYQATFEGFTPEVTTKDGVVTVRYPRRLWGFGGEARQAIVTLNTAIPWEIVIPGGASEIDARLHGLDLTSLLIKGGLSTIHLELPVPARMVPIKISGGASEMHIRRPCGVAVRAHLKGWVSTFVFDEQTFSELGNNVHLQSADFDPTAPHYEMEVASSASQVTIMAE